MTLVINEARKLYMKMIKAYAKGKTKKARKLELKLTQYYAMQ